MYTYKDIVVIENFDYSESELNLAKKQISGIKNPQIVLLREQVLSDKSAFEKICKDFEGCDILIYLEDEINSRLNKNSDVFDNNETAILKENFKVCLSYGCNMFLSDNLYEVGEMHRNKIPFTRALEASSKINAWVEEILNAKGTDGNPLSSFEKYLYAYMIVSEFKYNESEDLNESRDLSRILTGNNIVCVGYAQLLSELCNRIGIPCKPQSLFKGNEKDYKYGESNHQNCMVYLNDPKYNIDGFFMADACWDSFKSFEQPKTLCHSALPYIDLKEIFVKNKKLNFVEDKDEKYACFKFLQSVGINNDKVLISEQPNVAKFAKEHLTNGDFDFELCDLLKNTWQDVRQVVKSGLLEEESLPKFKSKSEAYNFVAECLINSFCGDYDISGSIDPDLAYENLESAIYVLQKDFSEKYQSFESNVLSVVKNLDIESDFNKLHILATIIDEKTLDDNFDKLKYIRENCFKCPSFEAYSKAVTNVLLSKGMKLDRAKKSANKKLKQSIIYADAYWEISQNATNPFSKAMFERSKYSQ